MITNADAIRWMAQNRTGNVEDIARTLQLSTQYVKEVLGRHDVLVKADGTSSRLKPATRHEAMHLMVDRDPCFRCNVRRDKHDEFGCGRWRSAP